MQNADRKPDPYAKKPVLCRYINTIAATLWETHGDQTFIAPDILYPSQGDSTYNLHGDIKRTLEFFGIGYRGQRNHLPVTIGELDQRFEKTRKGIRGMTIYSSTESATAAYEGLITTLDTVQATIHADLLKNMTSRRKSPEVTTLDVEMIANLFFSHDCNEPYIDRTERRQSEEDRAALPIPKRLGLDYINGKKDSALPENFEQLQDRVKLLKQDVTAKKSDRTVLKRYEEIEKAFAPAELLLGIIAQNLKANGRVADR